MDTHPTFDLLTQLKSKNEPEYTAIQLPTFDEAGDVITELNEAEQTLFKYKQMYDIIKRADEITDSVTCGQVQFEHMTEHDEVPDLEYCTLDVLGITRAHIRNQIAKFHQYCDDLRGEYEDMAGQAFNDSVYGTEGQQISQLFYATR